MARSKTEERLHSALVEQGLSHRQGEYIGPYEVDFLLGEKVVVEVDGYHHLSRQNRKRDARKSTYLRNLGYEVHRISARRVWVRDELQSFVQELQQSVQHEAASDPEDPSSLSQEQRNRLREVKKLLAEDTTEPEDVDTDPHRLLQRYLDEQFPPRGS